MIREPIDGSGYDILNAIFDNGRITVRPANYQGGEYDDAPAVRGCHAHIFKAKGGLKPDQMAEALTNSGIGDGTTNTMWRLCERAVNARMKAYHNLQQGTAA